jgi:3-keto-disaccharide hydrolase
VRAESIIFTKDNPMRHLLCVMTVGLLVLPGLLSQAGEKRAATPFNGKDLAGWKLKGKEEKSKWKVGHAEIDAQKPNQLTFKAATGPDAELVNIAGGGVDIYTEEKWGDCTIEVELMVPKGSNSGIYVMGEYEVQVLDSYGRQKVGPSDLGGLYGASAPRLNAARKPGEWQKFVIDFQVPRFQNGTKTANAKFLKVVLNDQVIHENVEMKGPTPSGVTGKEHPTGPLMFQGDHGPVAFRNIRVIPR